jgi:FSR family fosmidomycin resistance protein-like MFS transporter
VSRHHSILKSNTTGANHYVLASCCGTHIIQDGLLALKYVLFPLLAQAFGLSYAQVGLLRAISNSSTTLLEIPAGILAEKFGERRLLAMGLLGAGLGYLGVALAPDFKSIAFFFIVTGAGGAFQHSLASSVVVNNYCNGARRRALGIYNSSGDAGKLTFTILFSLGIGAGLAWNTVVSMLAAIALVFSGIIWFLLKKIENKHDKSGEKTMATSTPKGWGIKNIRRFSALGLMVFLDSTVQSIFLTFIAFILLEKGVSTATASGAVVLALAGGMVGKFVCGFMAARLGDRKGFVLIQILTVIGVAALVILPARPLLILLPLIGLVIQGSSTITYGSVADFIEQGRQSRGYSLIYTLVNSASVAGPFLFGFIADLGGLIPSIWILGLVICMTSPLSFVLAGKPQRSTE